jgi:hypothetical protein
MGTVGVVGVSSGCGRARSWLEGTDVPRAESLSTYKQLAGHHFSCLYVVTRDSSTMYTHIGDTVTRGTLLTPLLLSHYHIILVVSLSLLTPSKYAQRGTGTGGRYLWERPRLGSPQGVRR